MFFAGGALVVGESRVEGEHCAAAGSGAPACIGHMLLDVVVKSEFLVLLPKVFGQVFVNLILGDLVPAIFVRTVEGNVLVEDLLFRVFG